MVEVVMVILAFLGIGVYEGRRLVKMRLWREILVMSALLLAGLSITLFRIIFHRFPHVIPLFLEISRWLTERLGLGS